MTNNAASVKLPEFWEFAPTAWFVQIEAQFMIHGVTDDSTRYAFVVAALGRSTTTRTISFISAPPAHGKYEALKAYLLETFELSESERAQRLLEMRGLGDGKPSELMARMLSLLGAEEPNFLFRELFLRHMPPQVRTALASRRITNPRELAAEADRFFLAARSSTPEMLAPIRSSVRPADIRRPDGAAAATDNTEMCYFHARFGAKARRCRPPCNYKPAGNEKADTQLWP